MSKPKWIPCDGGRSEAGYKGHTGDCACRAIAIAVGMPYKEAYQLINNVVKGHEKPSKRKSSPSHARTGVYVDTMRHLSMVLFTTLTIVLEMEHVAFMVIGLTLIRLAISLFSSPVSINPSRC